MKKLRYDSVARLVTLTALPAAMLFGAQTASAQWSAQQPQPQTQQYPQQYPQQQQQRQRQQQRYSSQQELFVWQGPVDREIRLQTSSGRGTSIVRVGDNERGNGSLRSVSAMPNQDGIVTIQMLQGRGTADVIQQPNYGNGYTTVIRLLDPNPSAGMYRVAAYWQPSGNYNASNGNGRRNGNNRNKWKHGNNGNNGRGQGDQDSRWPDRGDGDR